MDTVLVLQQNVMHVAYLESEKYLIAAASLLQRRQ